MNHNNCSRASDYINHRMLNRERSNVRETDNDRNRERDTNRYVERVEDTLIKISRQACHNEIDK